MDSSLNCQFHICLNETFVVDNAKNVEFLINNGIDQDVIPQVTSSSLAKCRKIALVIYVLVI